jgi:hypothetical protein
MEYTNKCNMWLTVRSVIEKHLVESIKKSIHSHPIPSQENSFCSQGESVFCTELQVH